MNNSIKTTGLSVFALVMLITVAIDSIRNLPATALFGSSLIFFFIFSAIVFLIPAALVSAELSSSWTQKSGIYHWTKLAFGEKIGFFSDLVTMDQHHGLVSECFIVHCWNSSLFNRPHAWTKQNLSGWHYFKRLLDSDLY